MDSKLLHTISLSKPSSATCYRDFDNDVRNEAIWEYCNLRKSCDQPFVTNKSVNIENDVVIVFTQIDLSLTGTKLHKRMLCCLFLIKKLRLLAVLRG